MLEPVEVRLGEIRCFTGDLISDPLSANLNRLQSPPGLQGRGSSGELYYKHTGVPIIVHLDQGWNKPGVGKTGSGCRRLG